VCTAAQGTRRSDAAEADTCPHPLQHDGLTLGYSHNFDKSQNKEKEVAVPGARHAVSHRKKEGLQCDVATTYADRKEAAEGAADRKSRKKGEARPVEEQGQCERCQLIWERKRKAAIFVPKEIPQALVPVEGEMRIRCETLRSHA